MNINDVLEMESAWNQSGQPNSEQLSERHIQMMTVLLEIRDELRQMNTRHYEQECVRENTPRRYYDEV